MDTFRSFADLSNPQSLAIQMRRKRFELFQRIISTVPHHPRVIDLGGTAAYLRSMPMIEASVTIVNLTTDVGENMPGNCTLLLGDATNLPQFSDNSFDVVFSNSVIEHVGDWSAQQRMAKEVHRLAPRHYVQTPNLYFPIEPHYHAIGVQWLPAQLKRIWLRWSGRSYGDAELYRIRLLSNRALKRLFPSSEIYTERIWGLPKSFIVFRSV